MEVVYQKSELNISSKLESQQIELLCTKNKLFVDLSIVNNDQSTLELNYDLNTLENIKHYKNSPSVTKLRIGVSLLNLLKEEDAYFEFLLKEDNIYLSYDLNVKLLKRVFKKDVEREDRKLERVKALIGSLYLDYDAEKIYGSGNTLLNKNSVTKSIFDASTVEELEDLLINKINEIESHERDKKVMVAKNYHVRNLIIKSVLAIVIIVVSAILIYNIIYIIPNNKSQLNASSDFFKGSYEKVQDDLKTNDISLMTPYTKYILSVSTIKTQALSDQQKENILINLSPDIDQGVLSYWVYVGQDKIKAAYDQSITNNDAQQKAFALALLIQETQNSTKLTEEEKQTQVSTYQGELDQLNTTFQEESQKAADGVVNE